MTALVVQSGGQVELLQVPTPRPGPTDVLVRVSHCGVCGTDLAIVSGDFPVPRLPLVIGHECVGTVVAVGKQISHVQPDQLATIDPIMPCGTCHQCRYGRPALCGRATELGIHAAGGMAEYVVARGTNVHPLPPTVACTAGALVEPLACAIHGQDRGGVNLGDTVAIVGGGLQGWLHAVLARLRGAARVVVSARHARRRELVRSTADVVLDPDVEDPVDAVLESTDGRGADVVVEASGSLDGLRSAVRMVGRGGRVVVYGAVPPGRRLTLIPFEVFEREISIIGSFGGTGDTWPRALELIAAGTIDPMRAVDAEWELHEAPDALEQLRLNRDIVKGLVRVNGEPVKPPSRATT